MLSYTNLFDSRRLFLLSCADNIFLLLQVFLLCKLSTFSQLQYSTETVFTSFLFFLIAPDVSVCPSPVHAAGAKVKDLEDEADRLLEKLQPIKKLQDNLRRNISQIKELINQARKQANSVSHICDN